MAGLEFEGDLSQINDIQQKYIRSVIEEKGYTNNKVIVEPVGVAGDNYIANVKRIIVEDGEGGSFRIVAKIAPTQEILRKMGNIEFMFRNEHIMYTKVLPKLTQLEIAADIPPAERLRYAACYGSSNDVPNEVILLEDLKVDDFIMLDRLKSISPDCVKSVLRNFALLHSSSYALKYKEREVFDEYSNSLFDAWGFIDSQEEIKTYFRNVEQNACKLVDTDVRKKAINGALVGSLRHISKMSKYEHLSKHAIILQGDAWTNNVMFKFDGETLLESIMIDYQASKLGSPVSDILYMIFNCTDHEMRKEHFYDWIDYYHSELDKSLSNYGLKANFVYPKDQLDVDLKRYGKMSFGLSILLAGILSMKSEEASEMKESMETENMQKLLQEDSVGSTDPETNALLKKRLEGLVDSYHEFGLI